MPLFDAFSSQYLFYLFAISVACVVVVIKARSKNEAVQVTSDFTKFQKTYLYVYLLAMAADWLQGPYVYALYESYGFSRGEIGALFIYGFGSSLVVGTFVGSLADEDSLLDSAEFVDGAELVDDDVVGEFAVLLQEVQKKY